MECLIKEGGAGSRDRNPGVFFFKFEKAFSTWGRQKQSFERPLKYLICGGNAFLFLDKMSDILDIFQ